MLKKIAQLLPALTAAAFGCAGSPLPISAIPKAAQNVQATMRVDIPQLGHGTGVVINENGLILTCAHIAAAGKPRISIRIDTGTIRTFKARVIASDAGSDLAVLQIPWKFRETVTIGHPIGLKRGDGVYVLGYPGDRSLKTGEGEVIESSYGINIPPEKFYLPDAIFVRLPGNEGASGAGVFSMADGSLIGLWKMTAWVKDKGRTQPWRVLIPTRAIRKFLDERRIPYKTL